MLSDKQIKLLQFPYLSGYDALIADGAIRTGKTTIGSLSFVLWAMATFNKMNLGICGKTIASAKRNVIKPLIASNYLAQNGFKLQYSEKESLLTIKRGRITNLFYVFGGRDESSYMLIQGITLAGIFFDEVALMPQSFVEQGIARCSIQGAKLFFNCNPANPSHWFKLDWIDQSDAKRAFYLHFLLDDNPALPEEVKDRYKRSYSGVFYQRYILGMWVSAEGAIYPLMSSNKEDYIINAIPESEVLLKATIGIDFGGSSSNTAFVATGFGRRYNNIYVLQSKKMDSLLLDPDKLNQEFLKFIIEFERKYPSIKVINVYGDNAEPLLIRGLAMFIQQQQTRVRVNVTGCIKEEIIYRIECENIMLTQRRLKIMPGNDDLIKSFQDAVWDSKKSTPDKDVRLDNGTYCVDLLDAFEYSFERDIMLISK